MTRPTRAEATRAAGEALAEAQLINASLTPREVAEGAWSPGCGRTVDELEALIRQRRGLPARA